MDRALRLVFRAVVLIALGFASATVAEYVFPTATYCEPGGGCDALRAWSAQVLSPYALPFLGVVGFTVLFLGSFFEDRATSKLTALFAVLGGVVAAVLLLIQTQLGVYCWLCMGVDASAILAAVLAVMVAQRAPADAPRPGLMSPWWATWVIAAFFPIAYARLTPEPPIPSAVRARYERGAINVVEMADFECPYCRAMHPALKQALEDAPGEVNLVRVIVPLGFHEHARDAARAYHCAVAQERGEPMADRLFEAEDLSREGTIAIARALDLDLAAFESCLDDAATERRIREDEEFAEDAEMAGLPTVYIGERSFLGYDPTSGSGQFRDAVEIAQRGGTRPLEWWWMAAVWVIALGAGIAGAFASRKKPSSGA
jgi:uncharacterized membrane protein